MTPLRPGKAAPAIFQGCIFADCRKDSTAVTVAAFNHIGYRVNKLVHNYAVSVTGFQGMHRQVLLDMLHCLGVEVQKEMKLGSATHIVAHDVDDKKSKKLEHARMPDWCNRISIVSCKWVYDCIRQWQILPAGAYTSNCSNAEALAWQGQPGISSHSTSSPAKQTAQQLSPPSKSAALVPAPAVATIHNAGKQASASEHTNRPAGIAAAQAVGMSAVPGHMQQVNRQRQSGLQGRSSLPLQPKQQSMQPAEPDLLHQQKVQAAPGNRESLGGTQGAVTGLTHLALQKHDEAMQLADAANRLSDGVMPSEDTQALGLQVLSMHRQTIAMQVAEAEAATARLVAQLAEPSAEDHAAAEHASPVQSEDVFRPGKQSAPVIQKGSKPPAKQHAGTSRKSAASARVTGASNTGKAQKRGSGIVSVDGVTAGGKPDPKRQKLAGASSSTKQAAAGPRKNTAAQETLGGDPASFVGREVQQEFEEGVFKGKVTGYSKQSKWFLVVYEDGDRQDMTWKELQPCLLPLTGPQRPAQTQTGKAKRKLQPPPNHIRVERKAAAKAMPSSSPVGPVDANGGTPGREQHGDEEEAELANEQSREDVGPPTRVTTGNSPWTSGVARPDKPLLALGSMHTEDQRANAAKLTKIGVPCLTHRHSSRWDQRITHVVLPTLVRSAKSLAGMAGGRWILSTDFIEACASAESLVEPDEFELSDSDKRLISPVAPRHWRLRCQQSGCGAFDGLHVLIYGNCDKPGPDKDDLVLIMQAGGAIVSRTDKAASTLTKLIGKGLQLALVGSHKPSSDAGVKQLLKAKVPCATSQFIIDWLAHLQADLGSHMLFGSKVGWNKQLQHAHQSR